MLAALRGWRCQYITMDPGPNYNAGAMPERIDDDETAPSDNVDLVDLAGICAEVRECAPEVKYAFMHIRSATHDLNSVRDRLAANSADEEGWALCYQPIAETAVNYFWSAITAVADTIPDAGKMDGDQVSQLLELHKPLTPTPDVLSNRLKPEFIVACE
jgi:hypothetical protein